MSTSASLQLSPTGTGLGLSALPSPWSPSSPCRIRGDDEPVCETRTAETNRNTPNHPTVVPRVDGGVGMHSSLTVPGYGSGRASMPMVPQPLFCPPPPWIHTATMTRGRPALRPAAPLASIAAPSASTGTTQTNPTSGYRTPPPQDPQHHQQQPPPRPQKKRRKSERNYPFFHVRINVPTVSDVSTASTDTESTVVVTSEDRQSSKESTPEDTAFVKRVLRFLDTSDSPTFVAYTMQLEECPTSQRRHVQMVVKIHPKTTHAKMVSDWFCAFPHLQQHLRDVDGNTIVIGADGRVPANAKRADGAEWYCEPQVCTRGGAANNRYCMKEDTRIDGPWTKDTTQRKMNRRKHQPSVSATVNALHRAHQQVHPYHKASKPLSEPLRLLEPHQFYMWQRELLRKLVRVPDDRTILWLHEPQGKAGKSVFCKYLCCTSQFPEGLTTSSASSSLSASSSPYLTQLRAIMGGGRAQDMKYAIVQYHKTHKCFPNVVIFDLSRTQMDKGIDYQGIEEIKNGCFLATKYESSMVGMNSPHVVVFSNEEPRRDMLSEDRWDVTSIRSDNEHDTEAQETEPSNE